MASNRSKGEAIRQVTLGLVVYKTLAALADANIFTVFGRNLITLLTGSVTVAGDGGATTIKLQTETNTIDLCAATTVTGDAIGTTYFLTGELAVILNGTGNTPIIDVGANLTGMPSSPVIIGRLDTLDETIEQVAGGAGIRQVARGTLGGRTVIDAVVQMSTDIDRPRDEIEIDGVPPVRMTVEGGIMGDLATAAIIVNAVPRVVAHAPGLVTMLDLPVIAGKGMLA